MRDVVGFYDRNIRNSFFISEKSIYIYTFGYRMHCALTTKKLWKGGLKDYS